MTLKEGDIVRIDPDGKYSDQAIESNFSKGEIVGVMENASEGDQYDVDFENGYSNCYYEKELIVVKNETPNWRRRLSE